MTFGSRERPQTPESIAYSQSLRQQIIPLVRAIGSSNFQIRDVFLVGSVASNTAIEGSDVDLMWTTDIPLRSDVRQVIGDSLNAIINAENSFTTGKDATKTTVHLRYLPREFVNNPDDPRLSASDQEREILRHMFKYMELLYTS